MRTLSARWITRFRMSRTIGVSALMGLIATATLSSVGPAAVATASPSGTPFKIGYIFESAGPANIDEIPVMTAWVKWKNADG